MTNSSTYFTSFGFIYMPETVDNRMSIYVPVCNGFRCATVELDRLPPAGLTVLAQYQTEVISSTTCEL
jgi:hypothetical protein